MQPRNQLAGFGIIPAPTPQSAAERLVKVEGHRWTIEDSFETAKSNWVSTTTKPAPGRMAPPRLAHHACVRHGGRDPASRQ